jgi:cytochrome c oxidase subunit 2
MSFLFALIMVPMFYSLIVFRRRKGDNSDAEHMEGNTSLELTWTILPLFTVLIFAYLGAYSLGETRRVDPEAMSIKVTGFQWAWKFDYPDYGITTNELYLPVNKQVVLKMDSLDVIHSFWVPEFRIKQDVVPGRITEYRITPSLLGAYKVRCAELCGTSHSYMESPVVVVDQAGFASWIMDEQAKAAAAAATPEGRGERLVTQNGCAACHSINGSKGIGPTWRNLFGSQVTLVDGSIVTANEAYVAESILNPTLKVVEGFQPTMPIYSFSTEEVADILAYIETLK